MSENEEEPTKFIFTTRTVFAVLFTLLLGPGVGHLYLKKYKTGFLFLAVTLLFALHQTWEVLKTIPASQLSGLKAADASLLFNNFALQYPKVLFIYDIIFAALWAYAIVDVYSKSRETI